MPNRSCLYIIGNVFDSSCCQTTLAFLRKRTRVAWFKPVMNFCLYQRLFTLYPSLSPSSYLAPLLIVYDVTRCIELTSFELKRCFVRIDAHWARTLAPTLTRGPKKIKSKRETQWATRAHFYSIHQERMILFSDDHDDQGYHDERRNNSATADCVGGRASFAR